ncbi:MAG: NAD-glutamate dehydrogenase domain-containing protein, partial [Devosia sp.]
MQGNANSVRDALLSRAEALIHDDASFALFLKSAIAASAAEDLVPLGAEQIETILRRTHGHVTSYEGDASRIVLSPPQSAGEPLVIDVISPDMPFIVDSALAAVRAVGGTIRLFAHPVVRVEHGSVVAQGGRALSVLHIHSDPVSDLDALQGELQATMLDVGHAVVDWQTMLERVRNAAGELRHSPARSRDEAVLFLDWLTENNFTFLGMRQYQLIDGVLQPQAETGRGIMTEAFVRVLRSGSEFVESTPAHVDFMTSPEPLLITKANIRSRVHRRQHLDYVGVKLYGAEGAAIGELRIVGLFTSQAMATPHSDVPIIRRKIGEVVRRSGLDPQGHDGRALLSALDTYPRDELFQISSDQLFEFTTAIAGLYDRPRVRVLPRIDQFDNFVSILVFVPRDRYDSQARVRIAQYLAERYDGRVSAYYPHFPEGELVRLHVIIGRIAGPTPRPGRAELEARVEELTASFGDMLVAAAEDPASVSDYRNAFSQAYQSRHNAADAVRDIAVLRGLADDTRIAIRLHNRTGGDGSLGLKFYHHGSAIPLSDRVPMLEAFGFRVIDERTYTLTPRDGAERYIHDLVLDRADGKAFDMAALAAPVEEGLLAVWEGRAESDGLNALVLTAGLGWHDAALLRALSRYLRLIGISYSQRYIAQVLVTQSAAAAALVRLFDALFDPAQPGGADAARTEIATALDAMASLDEDRIVRRFLNLVESALRTNAWQRDREGNRRPALSIKFDSAKVEAMVAPRPF